MKQVHFSGAVVAVVAFVAVVTLTQKELQAAIAGKDKSASDAVRVPGAGKSGVADAKGAPPAWIAASTGTVALAEADDPAAQRALGFRYSQGVDVEKDEKKAFEWTKKAAEQGDARAMFNLAKDYANGDGVAKDRTKAITWYRKAAKAFQVLAEKGEKLDLRPLYDVGRELLDEESLHAPDVGMMFLGIAAQCGDAEAMRQYGALLASGENVKKDLDKGLLWLQKAFHYGDESAVLYIELYHQAVYDQLFVELRDKAEAGDKEAADRLNKCTELHRKGVKGSRVSLIESRALVGHAPSQAQLGLAYMLGKSVAQDQAKAVEWLRKAVAQGEYRAMLWLGTAYEHGHGVVKDDWRAFDLWRRSHELGWDPATEKLHSLADEYRKEAEKGNASAQFYMGVVHECGYAGEPDAAKAVEWYRKAAEQGHPGAQTFLGFALLTGSGVAKAPEQAVAWFQKAAEQGNPEAQQNLGRCLFFGEGCNKNQKEAVTWYRKAAEQGEAGAMFNLGTCYLEGTGVNKDIAEAAKWFKRAASLGHERSAKILEKLQKEAM